MTQFVHLHVHTQYSLLDGAADLERLLKTVADYGMPAVAMTDHGVMYGSLKFYQQAKKMGVHPVLGCEVYLAPRSHRDKAPKVDDNLSHLVLLAESNEGYRNLMKLVSIAHLDGFYYKPRVDLELLRKYSKGLIALSACMSGEIPRLILNDRYETAKERVGLYQEIFGRDSFYLELQMQHLQGQRMLNHQLMRLAAECGAPLVATNDVHYIYKEDAQVHDVLLCIQTGKTVDEPNRLKFPNAEFYLKTADEMAELFLDCPVAIENTVRIAERCQVELELGKFHMPKFEVPEESTAGRYLEQLCREGISNRKLAWNETYEKRLVYELQTIEQMGFAGYFLVVWDFVHYAKNHNIMVGPGRGSAAGSLVAYLLGITDLDPLANGLLFERFLNPERVSMPDIDIDFCYERRSEVIDYVRKRYGAERVAQIITFGTMAARAAVRDVGRVLGIPYGEVDKLAKLIPHELGISLREAIEQSAELRAMIEGNPRLQRLIAIASRVEGFPRHASTHAAGVVIAADPLTEYLPLTRSTEDEILTQFPMEDIEALGLLKMDFLGLRTLTVLRDTLRWIERNRHQSLELSRIPLDDPATYRLLQSGSTLGVFQLESRGIRSLMIRLKPENLSDITALVALYRPGPLGSGMVDDFIRAKHGEQKLNYLHPGLEPILRETNGVILYQEQVMRIASEIGGFSLGEADLVRRAMGKKKPEVLAAMRAQFVKGAAERGVTEAIANELFDLMEYFSGYGFNKSHSAAYGLVAYETAYFKANYPQEFMAALLTSVMGNGDKVGLYVEECRRMGLTILHPDINRSYAAFTPEGDHIRFGLMGIKNVGLGAIERIVAEREAQGEFRSLYDFCRRVTHQLVNKRVIESLVYAGAFDFTGMHRKQLLVMLENYFEQNPRLSHQRNQLNLLEPIFEEELAPTPVVGGFTKKELLEQEKEYLGVYLSGHPLDEWMDKFRQNQVMTIAELEEEADGKEVLIGGVVIGWRTLTTKAGAVMAAFRLEDLTGAVEVVVFPKLFEKVGAGFHPERIALVKGRLQEEEQGLKVLASQLRWLGE
ncbi:MAG TPA: DNA polymerase III subunit alpha [Bacillota bacterium]|nr:DNA polymerase III subunit alpha [Bacillota bacterium]HPT87150.1 DNA polymerase III subunit alpha [Bacillota bacterium]